VGLIYPNYPHHREMNPLPVVDSHHPALSWTAPLGIECFDICRSSELISRFGASHGFRVKTVASVKTANPKWRCPASQPVADSQNASLVMIHCNQHLKLEVPAHCLDTIRAILDELLLCGPDGDRSRSDMSPRSVGFQQVIVRSQLQSRRV